MLPIGDRYTMGPFEAAIAAEWINPRDNNSNALQHIPGYRAKPTGIF